MAGQRHCLHAGEHPDALLQLLIERLRPRLRILRQLGMERQQENVIRPEAEVGGAGPNEALHEQSMAGLLRRQLGRSAD